MATKKKNKGARKRKQKGKSLSEALAAKDAQKAADAEKEAAELEAAEREAAELEAAQLGADELGADELGADELGADEFGADGLDDADEDALDSEPPPTFDDDDDDDEFEDDEFEDDDDDDDDDDDEWEDDDDEQAAAQMGHQRYVMFGFMGFWLVLAYIMGRATEMAWSTLAAKDWFVLNLPMLAAVPHEGELISRASISLILGGLIGGGVVLRYYYNAETRQWADEVAEELLKVQWPTRKEVGNHTVVVMIASAVITGYLALMDRFWGYLTNIIYSAGT